MGRDASCYGMGGSGMGRREGGREGRTEGGREDQARDGKGNLMCGLGVFGLGLNKRQTLSYNQE